MNQTHPCDLSFKSGRWNRVGCCLFDGRRMAVRKSDGNAERAVGCLTTKSGVSFHMCSNEMISLWKLTTPLLFMQFIYFLWKKSIMSWHKPLLTCPRTQTSRWIDESNKTNSADRRRHHSVQYSVSPTFNCEALLPITVMSMKYDSQCSDAC